jgi:hypothetical protein
MNILFLEISCKHKVCISSIKTLNYINEDEDEDDDNNNNNNNTCACYLT